MAYYLDWLGDDRPSKEKNDEQETVYAIKGRNLMELEMLLKINIPIVPQFS